MTAAVRTAALVVSACVCVLAAAPALQAAEPAPAAAWFWRAQASQPGPNLPSAASGVPEGKPAIGFSGATAYARTVLRIALADDVTGGTLVLPIDPGASRLPETAAVVACPAAGGWEPVEAGRWDAQPLFSCPPRVEAAYDAEAQTLTVPLQGLVGAVRDGELNLMLTPAADTSTPGVAPAPPEGDPAAWTVVLEPPATAAVVQSAGASRGGVPADRPAPAPPPIELPDDTTSAPGGSPTGTPAIDFDPVSPAAPPDPMSFDDSPLAGGAAAPDAPLVAGDAAPGPAPAPAAVPATSTGPLGRWPLSAAVFLATLGAYLPMKLSRLSQNGLLARVRDAAEADPDTPALEVRDLAVRFGGVQAVRSVSFSVPRGQIVGLIGPNGAGKTTVLDAITGLVEADGQILMSGVDVTGETTAARAAAGLGRSYQDGRLFPSLTVSEALAVACEQGSQRIGAIGGMLGVGASAANERSVSARVDELIETMGLAAFADKFLSELSTGSRRIVDLAAMVAHGAKVLLLDEPSSGIAQRETEALGPVLLSIRERLGCTIVLIEHDMPLITSVADRLIALEVGRTIADGTPHDVVNDPVVVEAYLGTDDASVNRSGALKDAS